VVHTTQRGAPLTGTVLQEGVLVFRKVCWRKIPLLTQCSLCGSLEKCLFFGMEQLKIVPKKVWADAE
jgi:hypothetical protein